MDALPNVCHNQILLFGSISLVLFCLNGKYDAQNCKHTLIHRGEHVWLHKYVIYHIHTRMYILIQKSIDTSVFLETF